MPKSRSRAREGVREILEVVFGLGGVVGLSWWLPDAWISSHLLFCSFFIIVFAIAVRYQMRLAYSASGLAACLYGGILWLRPEMRAQPDLLVLALEPFLLLVSGLLTSDLLRWQHQRVQVLERDYGCIDEALRQTQQNYQQVVQVKQELERQVAGQSTSMATISDKVIRLWILEGGERSEALLDLLMYVIEAQACALYVQHHTGFHLSAARSSRQKVYAPSLRVDDPVVQCAIAQRKVVTVRDLLLEQGQAPAEVAIMAGPLLNLTGEMIGLVVVDHISLLKFTSRAVEQFEALLALASLALQSAHHDGQKTDQSYAGVLTKIVAEPALPA